MRLARTILLFQVPLFTICWFAMLLAGCAGQAIRIDYELKVPYSVASPQFQRTVGHLLGPSLVDGNRVETLVNGDEIFPAMLEAIRSARESVCFETFVYWSGQVSRDFADALSERAQADVPVHVLLDWFGSREMDPELIDQMESAGVEIERYNPPHWYTMNRLNNRTHRKLLIVDGRIGFTGGVGIADEWLGDAQDPEHWRDTHFRIEGPVVAQMQAAFQDNWLRVHQRVLHTENYFPPLPPQGPVLAQMFMSSPREGSDSMRLMYMLSIAAARERILIASAYFVPDELTVQQLIDARQRGVEIEILMPGPHMDQELVRVASHATWGPLLRAGVRLYEYQPTMFHCKTMIIDDLWVSVGSTNFDNRSFRLNDEANLNVLDPAFAQRQIEIFEADKAMSREVTLEMWEERPTENRFLGWLLTPFRLQM